MFEAEAAIEVMRRALRVSHYSLRTEQTYLELIRRFLRFTGAVAPGDLDTPHARRFLEHLAIERKVSASSQNQALSALLFFFKRVLRRELGDLADTVRARRGRRLPVVLSRDEVQRFLAGADRATDHGRARCRVEGTGDRKRPSGRFRYAGADRETRERPHAPPPLRGTPARVRQGIRSVQELLGHESVETTQIYTHVMAKPGMGVRSPLDAG